MMGGWLRRANRVHLLARKKYARVVRVSGFRMGLTFVLACRQARFPSPGAPASGWGVPSGPAWASEVNSVGPLRRR